MRRAGPLSLAAKSRAPEPLTALAQVTPVLAHRAGVLATDFYPISTAPTRVEALPAAGGHGVEPPPELADEQTQQVWAQKQTRSGNGGSGKVLGRGVGAYWLMRCRSFDAAAGRRAFVPPIAVVVAWTGRVFRMAGRVMANGSFWLVRCSRQIANPMVLHAEGQRGSECALRPQRRSLERVLVP
jgi:hypothetical protein